MAEGGISSKQLSVKGGISCLGRRKLLGVERKRSPEPNNFLLKNCSNVRTR